jgi:hypothetical protein
MIVTASRHAASGWARFAILCAALVSFGCGPEQPRPERVVVGDKLTLQAFRPIPDSDVFRADLTEPTGGISSGYRTRNVLFIDATGAGRWLLPGNGQVVYEQEVRAPVESGNNVPPPVALVVFAMPVTSTPQLGRLYLADLQGRRVEQVADSVKQLHSASLTNGAIALLYERSDGYILGRYDSTTLAKIREVNVTVPAFK